MVGAWDPAACLSRAPSNLPRMTRVQKTEPTPTNSHGGRQIRPWSIRNCWLRGRDRLQVSRTPGDAPHGAADASKQAAWRRRSPQRARAPQPGEFGDGSARTGEPRPPQTRCIIFPTNTTRSSAVGENVKSKSPRNMIPHKTKFVRPKQEGRGTPSFAGRAVVLSHGDAVLVQASRAVAANPGKDPSVGSGTQTPVTDSHSIQVTHWRGVRTPHCRLPHPAFWLPARPARACPLCHLAQKKNWVLFFWGQLCLHPLFFSLTVCCSPRPSTQSAPSTRAKPAKPASPRLPPPWPIPSPPCGVRAPLGRPGRASSQKLPLLPPRQRGAADRSGCRELLASLLSPRRLRPEKRLPSFF